MNRETLEKAKDLENDIKVIKSLQDERKDGHWINVVMPRHNDHTITRRMQKELLAFLDERKKKYEEELESL